MNVGDLYRSRNSPAVFKVLPGNECEVIIASGVFKIGEVYAGADALNNTIDYENITKCNNFTTLYQKLL